MKPIKLPKQLSDLLRKLQTVGKHHYFIFTVLLLCSLAVAVYMVDSTLRSSLDNTYRDQKYLEALKSSFDQDTINKIENLQKSSESSTAPPSTPAGSRTNPFAE